MIREEGTHTSFKPEEREKFAILQFPRYIGPIGTYRLLAFEFTRVGAFVDAARFGEYHLYIATVRAIGER